MTAPATASLLDGYSIEVMPATAERIENFREVLPADTRVYVAHIEGTPLERMVETCARIAGQGYPVMPHIPARGIASRSELDETLARYRGEAGVEEALMIAGGNREAAGPFASAMDVLETGLLDQHGFRRLHVAGHPEGNVDIDPPGSTARLDGALQWKRDFAERTDAAMAIATQFCFEVDPVLRWAARLLEMGVDMPVHVGLAGPTKLQTLIKYAIACGVGSSLRVLQRRARSMGGLLRPHAPDQLLAGFDDARSRGEAQNLASVHIFPFGGIRAAADWARGRSA